MEIVRAWNRRVLLSTMAALVATFSLITSPTANSSTSSARCWSSGSGIRALNVCVSPHGNISLESPAGVQHLFLDREGYALCSNSGTHGFDSGAVESAWGASTITFPTSTTALVTRTTSDGRLKLDMKLSRDTGEFDATVQTTVTNLSATSLSNVRLARYADPGDLLPFDSHYDFYSGFSVAVWQLGGPGIALRGISNGLNGVQHAVDAEFRAGWTIDACIPAGEKPPLTFGGFGDYIMWSIYNLGTLTPGQKKTVKHVYSRM